MRELVEMELTFRAPGDGNGRSMPDGILVGGRYRPHLVVGPIDQQDAIIEAAAIRLRPILMTTAAMVTGLIPLLTASGAGAASRFSIGLVVVAGMSIAAKA